MTDRSTLLVLFAIAATACSGPSSPSPASRRDGDPPAAAMSAAATAAAAGRETAILAGGCFWGMQDLLRKIPGVIETKVGYTGGETTATTYEQVHDGTTGQAEAVRIVFDPKVLSYADLLEHWFFRMHDPTTLDRQGNDVGTQYRSAIFVTSSEQRRIAEVIKAKVDHSGLWPQPVVTQIADAGPFAVGEEYHQDYLVKNPNGYTCHFMR
jgi:methionine-S-sulfoxide reductase